MTEPPLAKKVGGKIISTKEHFTQSTCEQGSCVILFSKPLHYKDYLCTTSTLCGVASRLLQRPRHPVYGQYPPAVFSRRLQSPKEELHTTYREGSMH